MKRADAEETGSTEEEEKEKEKEKEKEALNEEKVWRERHKERVFVEEVVKEGEVTKVINDLGKNNEDASGKGARVPAGECLGEGVA